MERNQPAAAASLLGESLEFSTHLSSGPKQDLRLDM